MRKQLKFGVGASVIVISLACLAWMGYGESKTYYHTIAETQTLQGNTRNQRMRIAGTVAPGTIRHLPGRIDFVLNEEGKSLNVSYIGSDPLPDTFVDKSQALVEGRLAPEGGFVAERVQAKCASKYEAAPTAGPGRAGASSSPQSSTM